jgi:hypothetical protein
VVQKQALHVLQQTNGIRIHQGFLAQSLLLSVAMIKTIVTEETDRIINSAID